MTWPFAARLRIIDASASTNFFIDLGALVGELVRVDGEAIVPRSAYDSTVLMAGDSLEIVHFIGGG